jgi:hypothetical protein
MYLQALTDRWTERMNEETKLVFLWLGLASLVVCFAWLQSGGEPPTQKHGQVHLEQRKTLVLRVLHEAASGKCMKTRFFTATSIFAAVASALCAQGMSRRAVITGDGSPDRGKCTIEVRVDGAAQVEIRGNTATLRDMNGRQPQWRRFECTGAMPPNPANFRFQGIDGRGRQTLIQDPRNGGAAVVQIEDRQGGAEGYTFDIMWDSRGDSTGNQQNYPQADPHNSQYRDRVGGGGGWGAPPYRPNYRDTEYYRQWGHGFGTEEAIRVCRDSISEQASRRFHTRDIHILSTRMDDNPGRNDWVIGRIDVHPNNRGQVYNFACSVNFNSGRVRTAEIDAGPIDWDPRWR